MAHPDVQLPKNVLDALRGGNKMEAIKRLRQATGVGLAEARERVEAHVRGKTVRSPPKPGLSKSTLNSVASAIQRGSVLEAFRLIRDDEGLGLKEAKAAIEGGSVAEAVKLLRDRQGAGLGKTTDAIERARPSYVPSPDTPPDTFHKVVTALWWVLALALAGIVAYYFLVGG